MEIAPPAPEDQNDLYVRLDGGRSGLFIKENVPAEEIFDFTEPHVSNSINPLLRVVGVSAHDQPHQWRTAINADSLLVAANATHIERVRSAFGALVHDIRYDIMDPPEHSESSNDAEAKKYIGAKAKSRFSNHAKYGAETVLKKMAQMRKLIEDSRMEMTQKRREMREKYRTLLTYQDEHGEQKLLTERDSEEIAKNIQFHNGYGKKAPDLGMMTRESHAVRGGDKMDFHGDRVDEERMHPDMFEKKDFSNPEEEEQYRRECCHVRAQYCVTSYKKSINPATRKLKVAYNVDLSRFTNLMKSKGAGHMTYMPEEFKADVDFGMQYNFRQLAISARALYGTETNEEASVIEFHFKSGEVIVYDPYEIKEEKGAKDNEKAAA